MIIKKGDYWVSDSELEVVQILSTRLKYEGSKSNRSIRKEFSVKTLIIKATPWNAIRNYPFFRERRKGKKVHTPLLILKSNFKRIPKLKAKLLYET